MSTAPLCTDNGDAFGLSLSALGDRLERSLGERFDKIENLLQRVRMHSDGQSPDEVSQAIQAIVSRWISQASELNSRSSEDTWQQCSPQPNSNSPDSPIVLPLSRRDSPVSTEDPQVMEATSGYVLRLVWERSSRISHANIIRDSASCSANLVTQVTNISSVPRPHIVLRPSSLPRLLWDIFGMVLIAYDIVMIPFSMAFLGGEPASPLQPVFWIGLMYWTLDLVLTFFTGYYRSGEEELRMKHIALHYVCTWLCLDLIVVGADWFEVHAGTSNRSLGLMRVGKSLRILRIVRTFRLLRLIKLRQLFEHIQDHIMSEHAKIVLTMLNLILIITIMNHIIACSWYGLSMYLGSNADAEHVLPWVKHYFLDQRTIAWRYFTALHWSLTQLSPASMEVMPQRTEERVFAVCVLLFALLVFSSFVSSITTAMTDLRRLNKVNDKNISVLRRFLRGRHIQHELAIRVLRYAEHQLSAKQHKIQEGDVCLLRMLSKPLQMELALQSYKPTLMGHPFFRCYSEQDPSAMLRICSSAVKIASLSAGDTLFTEGASDTSMFFVHTGLLKYVVTVGGHMCTHSLQPQSWCSEAALWTEWVHSGTAVAVENSEVLSVQAAEFADVTHVHRKVLYPTAQYGRLYVERLNETQQQGDDFIAVGDLSLATLLEEDEGDEEQFVRGAFPHLEHVCRNQSERRILGRGYSGLSSTSSAKVLRRISSKLSAASQGGWFNAVWKTNNSRNGSANPAYGASENNEEIVESTGERSENVLEPASEGSFHRTPTTVSL